MTELRVKSKVDSGNSSTTPLAGGAAFTGTGIDVLNYPSITVYAFADQNSATDGLSIQFSSDNSNFRVLGLEATWLAGATNTDFEIKLYKQQSAGWTYNAGSTPTPPTPLAQLTTDHSTDDGTVNGESGAWKRANLNSAVMGGDSEGIIIEVTTNSARQITIGNFELQIRPD